MIHEYQLTEKFIKIKTVPILSVYICHIKDQLKDKLMTKITEIHTNETGSVEPQETENKCRQLNDYKMTHYASEWRQGDRRINRAKQKLNRLVFFWVVDNTMCRISTWSP